MGQTRVDPVACARVIVYGCLERERSTRSLAIAYESWTPRNVVSMVACILLPVAVVAWFSFVR
jgi:hypothetical protein